MGFYSICSSPSDTEGLEITVEHQGAVAEQLFKLRGGEALDVQGPIGKWGLDETRKSIVMISRGVGIAPFRSMLRYIAAKGLPNKMHLFYEEKNPDRLLYRRELESFEKSGVKMHITMSDTPEASEGLLWDGPRGPLTAKTVTQEVDDLKEAHYLLCGSGRLIDSLLPGIRKAKVPEENLSIEKWGDF